MAKTPLRAVLDKTLAKQFMYVPGPKDGGVIVEGNKDSRRIKYVLHRTLTTKIMAKIVRDISFDRDSQEANHRYIYVALTSPKCGAWHGMVVGTTNNETVIKRLTNSGPVVYSDADELHVHVPSQKDYPELLNDELFNWEMAMGHKCKGALELYTQRVHEHRMKAQEEAKERWAESQRTEQALELLEKYEQQQEQYNLKHDAYDAACSAGFKNRILSDMHDELLVLADAWEVVGMPLKRKK